ncbi:MAG: AMP-binding protein [Myxococcales bacterium]|nr:AMP-binding protein [Myxococcales bacterium]MDH3484605.1 AMP-binding protein [Myxococcales bacterium]
MLERLTSRSWRAAVIEELRAGPRALRGTVPWLMRMRRKQIRSLVDVVIRNAEDTPHDLAFEMDQEHLTWSGLDEVTSRIAHVLASAGVGPGGVVALLAENSPFYIASVLGITRVGATAALINNNLRGRPLAHAVEVSKATAILVSNTLEPGLRDCEEVCQSLDRILVFDEDPWHGLLADTPSSPYPSAKVRAGDDFVYIYTSGTTGLPKPCRVSHARAILAGAGFGALMYEFRPGDKLYCALPLYHSNGLLLGAAATIIGRVPMALRRSFSASAFWDDIHRYNATAMLYIGELCRYLVNSPPHPSERPNPIRVAVGNGLRPDIWPRFQSRFGIATIREFYGATEAPGFIANLSGREGSVGRVPFAGFKGYLSLVRYDVDHDEHLRDSNGFCIPCENDEPGELLIRIASVAGGLEYRGYTDESATQKKILSGVFRRGDRYFRTGDLLRRDGEGFYYFVDRIGDTFRWKGENVSTAEVADVITRSDEIAEATVVGVHVPNMDGQAGLAAVVPVDGFNPDGFWRVVSELPPYAQPRFVRVMNDLAKTGTLKIQKTTLRKEGVDPASISDAVYVRTDAGYERLTPERWVDLKEGKLKL